MKIATRAPETISVPSKTCGHYFWLVFIGALLVKLLLCEIIPVTGDEAYYAIWGEFPAWGYYDHTPFIGWFLYPFVHFVHLEHHALILRLPTVLMTSVMALVIFYFLKSCHKDTEKAALAGIAFLISPLSFAGILITTDTPVILFSFLSGICVLKALQKQDHLGWYALSGLFLGVAFFSKYFAVLLALSYIIYFLWGAPSKKRLAGLAIMLICVLPFGLENLYWNYTHSWANILFNVYNRNVTDHFGLINLLKYIVTLIYIFTPVLFYYLFIKHRAKLFSRDGTPVVQAVNFFIVVPVLFFLILSTHKEIGLHWPLAFVTFAYLWAGLRLSLRQLKFSVKFLAWFGGLHLLLIFILALLPMSAFQKLPLSDKAYNKLVYFFKHKEINHILKPYHQDYIFTSLNYVQADMFFYDSGYFSPTFGIGSVHGRQDDLMTDFKKYAHKNMLLFYTRPPREEEYAPYFAKTSVHEFSLDGTEFYYVLGDDFNYAAYRDSVLTYINHTYWQVPHYLPHTPSFFCMRYFPESVCEK